jgi:GNAT superfamily N-acetyltransferase
MKIEINSLIEKLDNPVWNALSENHANFCIDFANYKFYKPEYSPFGAFVNVDNNSNALKAYSKLIHNFYVVGNEPQQMPENLRLKKELVCNQMVIQSPIEIEFSEDIVLLNNLFQKELIDLVNLVQPGYFKEKTSLLGNYYGIFRENKLIAVTGERMKMNDATEVSAVVTHPEHLGKGYAKQLVAFVTNKIFEENKLPFLHVAETNIGAVKLYEKLGYETRRKMSFWHYELKEN